MNPWIDTSKELPPSDGIYLCKVNYEYPTWVTERPLEYDGIGFSAWGTYYEVRYWTYPEREIKKEKKYGKILNETS